MFFFFNDTATTEIYTLSLHDALPIFPLDGARRLAGHVQHDPVDLGHLVRDPGRDPGQDVVGDRKSTRLNSSHANISYAVFCLKKKKSSQSTPHSSYICIPCLSLSHPS